ncbi:MAG: LamG-like jellyroll fold domain-containing protein [Variibacter sp.]
MSTHKIERSARFDSADSAYLSRTPSAGNRKTYTISMWVKRAGLGTSQTLFYAGTDASNKTRLNFSSTGTLQFYDITGGSTERAKVFSNAVYLDPSVHMHVVAAVDTTQATSSDRIKLYVGGGQITSLGTASYPSQNTDLYIGAANDHRVGGGPTGDTQFCNCLISEVNYIDGLALDPSYFGETDPATGEWAPKEYTGSYGTNGFRLDFSDNSNTTSSTLGKDRSGNNNDWTPNNFSVSAGVGNDSLVDTPTNYGTDTGAGGEVRGNYCTLNPLDPPTLTTLTNGNLDLSIGSGKGGVRGTFGVSAGKWVYECTGAGFTATNGVKVGWSTKSFNLSASSDLGAAGTGFGVRAGTGSTDYFEYNGSSTNLSANFTSSTNVLRMEVDFDTGHVEVFKVVGGTPTSVYSATHSGLVGQTWFPTFVNETGSTTKALSVNFGQRPLSSTATSGFKTLCTQNLPDPAIKKPSEHFRVVLDTGANIKSSAEAVFAGSDFLEWIKDRANSNNHQLIDTVRGTSAVLQSNSTGAETTYSAPSGNSVGWVWKKGPLLDIVSYTGNATNRTIAHALGVAPALMIFKNRTDGGGQPWNSYHKDVGATKRLRLNATDAAATSSSEFNDTAPTSSVFSVGTSAATNGSGADMIAFLFAEIPGFSKFGIYTGNGSADGPFIWCGFKPRWLMVKRTDTTGDWLQYDAARELYNPRSTLLFPNSTAAEFQNANYPLDFVASGFKLRAGGASSAAYNASGATYIFAAFAEAPFKYSAAQIELSSNPDMASMNLAVLP